jgi:cell division protein FtsB
MKGVKMTLRQLEADVNEQLAEIRHKLRSKSPKWLIVLCIAIVIGAVLFITVFKPKASDNSREIEGLKREIEGLKRNNQVLDSLIKIKSDEYKANRPTETRIIHQYEKIPTVVRDLNKDQLRREVTDFE